jgi:hypothetical protein
MISGYQPQWVRLTAMVCVGLLTLGDVRLRAQEQSAPAKPAAEASRLKSPDQLDSLVAPIALYPDPLLAQVLAASTYPLEIVQAQRWLTANSKLTGEDLTKAAAKEPWDASVQALVAFPDVVKLLDANIQWTQDLGNAFLDQQVDVMEAVQRMRKKAKDGGKLETSKEQKVEVKTVENKTVIEIQPSNPQVIYVPSYNPTVVYGAPPVYAYPPVVYPTSAYVATAAVSFGVGVMMGAFWSGCCGGGGWGWGCAWGGNNITINNNFGNRYGYTNISGGNRTNISGGNRTNIGGDRTNVGSGNRWQHNPEHRRSVPYSNRDTAQRFSGSSRTGAGQTERFGGRSGQADRGAATRDVGTARGSGLSGSRAGGAGQDRIGDRSIQSGDRRGQNSALSGSSRARTQAASDRGFSSSRQSAGFGGGGSRSGGSRSFSGGGRSFGGGGRRR